MNKEFSKSRQYIISVLVILSIIAFGLILHNWIGYRVVAFMLLVSVSLLAMFFDIVPVLFSAGLSALLWNFLFIPPRFTLSIGTTEDRWLLLMYFVIAMIHSVLMYRIIEAKKEIQKREVKQNAIKFYNTLLNSLSHELRTPITTIMGATDNLNNADHLSENDKAVLLAEISIATDRLNQQVENLLSMSRLESGMIQLKKDWVDVNELIYKTIQKLEPAILKYRIQVYTDDQLPLFKLDFGLMEQVVHNLLNNCIQHTPEGTEITVKASCIDEALNMEISDAGKGFPESEIDKVFEKFYRVTGSKPGGTGLGLSIVKGFVEAQGGTISLKNLPLRGAQFIITIPTEVTYINKLKSD